MFSEWRKRSKLFDRICGSRSVFYMWTDQRNAYDLSRAAFKAGVRAGIKQEQARRNASRKWQWGDK